MTTNNDNAKQGTREFQEAKADYVGYIEGVRTWRAVRTPAGWRLSAQYAKVAWPRGVFEAKCQAGHDHAAPGDGCNCGVQAVWPENADRVRASHTRGEKAIIVVGTVHAWGRIFTGSLGWRAEFAQVNEITEVVLPSRVAGHKFCQARPRIDAGGGRSYKSTCSSLATHVLHVDHTASGTKSSSLHVCDRHAEVLPAYKGRRECGVRDCHKAPVTSGNDKHFSTCKVHAPSVTKIEEPGGDVTAEILRDLRTWYECIVPGDAERDSAEVGS